MAFRRLCAEHPIAVYAVLACLFAWAFTIAHGLGAPIEGGQFPLGPILAAAVVSSAVGRPGLRRWWAALVSLRAGLGWYLLAVAAPIVLVVVAVVVNYWFGAPLPTAVQLGGWRNLGPVFIGMLLAIGIGEEAGWTAFAAPRLLEGRGVLRAWLILATIRTIWHLPLMLGGELSVTLGVAGNFAFQFLVLWLVVRTRVWFLAALWHAMLNTAGGQFLFRMASGADQDRLGLIMVAGYVTFAAAVAVADRDRLFGTRAAQQSS